jgi:hypothetical protein
MTVFTKESLLIAKNWDTIEDIHKAEQQLRQDLSNLLLSLKTDLTRFEWWSDDWNFKQPDETQIYISNKIWKNTKGSYYTLWVGIEDFEPENIFGMAAVPTLYVWVYGRRDLAQALATELNHSKWEVLGELDTRANDYVVKKRVKKCLPEEVETYPDTARQQIVDFMAHYANILIELDPIIQEHLKD